MGTKVTISPITNPENSSFPTELNAAIDVLSDEFDKVVYRDGSFDLTGDMDAGSNRIINLPAPLSGTEPLRLADIASITTGADGEDGADAVNPNYTYAINTLAPGSTATLVPSGTYPNITLTFGIPRGDPGASGALGDGTYSGIIVSGTGSALDVVNGHITYARMANAASAGLVGATGAGVHSLLSFATVKTNLALVKGDVGLGNVDNTSDANKPISTATQTALNLKLDASALPSQFLTVTNLSADTTLSNSHNNNLIRFTGTTSRTITLNGTPTAGFVAIVAHRGTVTSWTLNAASGIYLNGAASTVTSITAAPGAHFTLIHEGSGVWSADGRGLT